MTGDEISLDTRDFDEYWDFHEFCMLNFKFDEPVKSQNFAFFQS